MTGPLTAAEIWRDYETDGVPSSGAHQPSKSDIRAWGASVENGVGLSQRSVTTSPVTIAANDGIINFNISTGSPTCTLPLASTRAGADLTFKDAGANAAAHNFTITFSGGELCDGQSSVVIKVNRGEVTLRPYNDGVNTGWSLR